MIYVTIRLWPRPRVPWSMDTTGATDRSILLERATLPIDAFDFLGCPTVCIPMTLEDVSQGADSAAA